MLAWGLLHAPLSAAIVAGPYHHDKKPRMHTPRIERRSTPVMRAKLGPGGGAIGGGSCGLSGGLYGGEIGGLGVGHGGGGEGGG